MEEYSRCLLQNKPKGSYDKVCPCAYAHIMYLSVYGYWDDGKRRWTKLRRGSMADLTPDGLAGGLQEASGGNGM